MSRSGTVAAKPPWMGSSTPDCAGLAWHRSACTRAPCSCCTPCTCGEAGIRGCHDTSAGVKLGHGTPYLVLACWEHTKRAGHDLLAWQHNTSEPGSYRTPCTCQAWDQGLHHRHCEHGCHAGMTG